MFGGRMIVSFPAPKVLASSIAARSVQTPFPGAVSHMASPGFASAASNGLLTVKVAAWAKAPLIKQQTKTLRYLAVQRILFLPTDMLLVCLFCWLNRHYFAAVICID